MELQRYHPTGASTHLQWYHDKGLKVMGATAASCGSSPFIPRENSLAGYIKGFSKLVAQNQLEGILATAWDDGSPHSETVWRGYIAQGEYGWNPTARTVEAFKATCPTRIWLSSKWQPYGFSGWTGTRSIFFDDALVNSGKAQSGMGNYWFYFNQPTGSRRTRAWSRTYQQKNSPNKGGTKTIWKKYAKA